MNQPRCDSGRLGIRGCWRSRNSGRWAVLAAGAALVLTTACGRKTETTGTTADTTQAAAATLREGSAKKPEKKRVRKFAFADAFGVGAEAARIYDELRAGAEGKSRAYNYSTEAEDGTDKELVEFCVRLCETGTFEYSPQDLAMKQVNLPAFMLEQMPERQLPRQLRALVDKRPEWKVPLAEMIVDLMSARLSRLAAEGLSLLPSGDDVLFCADQRFESQGKDRSGFDRVVIGYFSMRQAKNETAMLGMMSGTIMMAQKDKITDFFVAPRWKNHLEMALALQQSVGERGDQRMEAAAEAFDSADLPASALLVRSVWMTLRGTPKARVGDACLESVARVIGSRKGDPRRWAVALGYWAQAVADPREREKPESHAKVQGLLQQISRSGALYDATVLAFYLDETGFELPLPDPLPASPTAVKAHALLTQADQEKSPAIKLAYYEDAAATGDVASMLAIAQAWEKGTVGHVDLVKARDWCDKAAEAGLPAALNQLGVWAEFGTGVTKHRNPDQARAYYVRAANRGDSAGLCNAARVHQTFARRPIDPSIAVALYEGAVRLGDPIAMNHLGVLYDKGTVVAADSKRAAELWQAAADLDCAPAQSNLAFCFLRGSGVTADPGRALELMRSAAASGLPAAKFHLGQFRIKGVGAPADSQEGAALIADAANHGYGPALEYQQAQRQAAEYARQVREMRQGSYFEQMSTNWQQGQADNFAAQNNYAQWQAQQKMQAWRSGLGQRLGLPVFHYRR